MMRWRSITCSFALALAFSGAPPAPALAEEDPFLSAKGGQDFHPSIAQSSLAEIAGSLSEGRGREGRKRGIQINDPALDHVTNIPGTRPYEFSIQSETTIAAAEGNIVVGYNTSAGQEVISVGGRTSFAQRLISGFSVSHDGGATWAGGFIPPSAGSVITFGDPSVVADRAGNFYYASLGMDAARRFDVSVSKSTDGGDTFAPATVVALDEGADKDWLTAGPDPFVPSRDNLYLTWTRFVPTSPPFAGSQVVFARSTDGGATWSAPRVLFAPSNGGPNGLSSFIQFTNPVVDASSGRLYIPFLHGSNFSADFIKVLVSDDAGLSFSFLEFDSPGAPDRFGFPNVTPGTRADCGTTGGRRLVLHAGQDVGGGRVGLPRFVHSTRLITQPSAAAANGRLFIAFNSSTSSVSGDSGSRSEIHLLFSADGGASWQLSTVVAASDDDPQHVHPAISVDSRGKKVAVGYYVQQDDEQLRVDLAIGEAEAEGVRFENRRALSAAFDMTPNNIPLPTASDPFLTTNYDRTIAPCYNIGEYMGTTFITDSVLAAWGDDRNSWTSPQGSPASGTHSQPDVFFGAREAR